MTGSIPAELGNLSTLFALSLENNQLTGIIPPELAMIGSGIIVFSDRFIDLNDNNLEGCYPNELIAWCPSNFKVNLFNNPNLPNGGDFATFCNNQVGLCPENNSANCEALQFSSENNQIIITNLSPSSRIEIIGRNTDWQIVPICSGDCSETQIIPDLMAGDYTVKVQLFGQDGSFCFREEKVEVIGGGGNNCDHPDFDALVALNNSISGLDWDLSDCDICNLEEITCNRAGRVERFSIGGNRFSGTIPEEIGDLSELISLSIIQTNITGNIPNSIGNLTNLRILSLSNNELTGNIPSGIGSLTIVSELNLSDNQLTGPIPSEIGNMSSARILFLNRNNLTGSIPPELGNLPRIVSLALSGNQLTGSIPAELGDLSTLVALSLENNQLSGSIPAST